MLVETSGDAGDEDCRHEDRRENQGDTDDRPGKLFHSCSSRILRSQPLLDVALYAFNDDDGIVYHQADGQHHSKHRKGIDGEAEQREKNKRAHQRHRHCKHGDQGSAPVLQEEVDHQEHQHDGDQEGLNNLPHAFGHGGRLVKRYGVIHVLGKALLHLGHQFADACGGLDRIGTRQLVNGDYCGGPPIQATDNAVIVRAQFDSRDIFHANDSAIRSFTDHDVFKLLGRRQTPLRQHRICELLVRGSWLTAQLTSRIHLVLCLDRVDDLSDGDAQLRQLVRFYPEPHGIFPCAENLRLADAVQACNGIIEVDVGIVGQEFRIVSAMRRGQGDQHERSGH